MRQTLSRITVTAVVALTPAAVFAPGAGAAEKQNPTIKKYLAKSKAERVVTVEQSRFRLDVYQHQRAAAGNYKRIRRYAVAVGLPQFPTPNGVFKYGPEIKNPSWLAPHSPWVPKKMRGKLIKYTDPLNPFVRWFVPVIGKDLKGKGTNGVGIHGTKHPETLRTRASHGCIRMNATGISSLVKVGVPGDPVVIVP